MAARILFLHHTAIIGGAELHLLAVARHFRESSTVVLFADGPFRHALETAGVQVRVFPSEWAAEGVRHENPRLSPRTIRWETHGPGRQPFQAPAEVDRRRIGQQSRLHESGARQKGDAAPRRR